MLVLSRKTDEVLLIDGKIEVRVLEIKQGRVRLGIEAPKEVPIQRQETLNGAVSAQTESLVYSRVG